MSATVPQIPTAPKVSTRDKVIAGANSAGDLIAQAAKDDPQMFATLTGSFNKWVYAPLVLGAVAKVATTFGLNWSADTDDIIAAAITLGGLAVWHWFAPKVKA